MRRLGRYLLALLVSMSTLLALPAGVARATTATIPFNGFGGFAIDPANGHIFVSGGAGNDLVSVYDLSGSFVTNVTNLAGASDLLLHNGIVYVAMRDAGAIGRIDAATLTRLPRFGLGTLSAPRYLAWASRRLWIATCSGTGVIASIKGNGSGLVKDSGFSFAGECENLESTSAKPHTVFAAGANLGPTTLYKLHASSDGSLSINMSVWDPGIEGCGSVEGMAIRHDGRQVLLACGYPYFVEAMSASALGSARTWPTGPYPVAAAVSADDTQVAAGVWAPYDNDVYVFPYQSQTPTFTYDFDSSSEELQDDAVAFSPDGNTLYAVSSDGTNSTLHVFDLTA